MIIIGKDRYHSKKDNKDKNIYYLADEADEGVKPFMSFITTGTYTVGSTVLPSFSTFDGKVYIKSLKEVKA